MGGINISSYMGGVKCQSKSAKLIGEISEQRIRCKDYFTQGRIMPFIVFTNAEKYNQIIIKTMMKICDACSNITSQTHVISLVYRSC